jgi:recombination protein RecR
MSSFLPKSIQQLIDEFSRLPGVGPKSAQRLAMHLLRSPQLRVQALSSAIGELQNGLRFCRICWNIAEAELCGICSDPMRKQDQICVVEDILDIMALEKTLEYRGTYHVLHGVLSPVDGIGPDQLKIDALMQRVRGAGGGTNMDGTSARTGADGRGQVERPHRTGKIDDADELTRVGQEKPVEIILATNPSLEGETTAMYLLRLLKPLEVKITRIARGLPAGGDLDYADELTLSRAMQGRAEYV